MATTHFSGPLDVTTGLTDGKVTLGIQDCSFVTGTWTPTRNAASDYSNNKTAAANTSHISADITELLRTTSSKGMKLKSFDVIYSIGTAALTTHTAVVNSVTYANATAVAVATHGGTLSGSLATATQATPYLSTITLGTQSFFTTDDAKVNIEIEVVAALTSVYKFYGIVLNFDHNLV